MRRKCLFLSVLLVFMLCVSCDTDNDDFPAPIITEEEYSGDDDADEDEDITPTQHNNTGG